MTIFTGVVALVDDDGSLLRSLERVLMGYAYRVKIFSSAEQYLEGVEVGEVSCAVLDVQLGAGQSGLDLGAQIAQGRPATPIVFMSGTDDPAVRERAAEIGCIAFLDKPFSASRLVEIVMSLDAPLDDTVR